MRTRPLDDEKFGCDIYFIAAVLNPSFNFHWLEADVAGSERDKEYLRRKVKGIKVPYLNVVNCVLTIK